MQMRMERDSSDKYRTTAIWIQTLLQQESEPWAFFCHYVHPCKAGTLLLKAEEGHTLALRNSAENPPSPLLGGGFGTGNTMYYPETGQHTPKCEWCSCGPPWRIPNRSVFPWFCTWNRTEGKDLKVLTTERELESSVPSWPSMLETVISGRSMFWGWNGRRPLWFMGWHREWYPDSISFKCTREWSGNDGGVIGGILKSSLSRLGPGKDWRKKRNNKWRVLWKSYEHCSRITIKVIQNKQKEPNSHTSKHSLQFNKEYFQDQYIIQMKSHHYVCRKKHL